MRHPEMLDRIPDVTRSGRLYEELLLGSANLKNEELTRVGERELPYEPALELAKKLQKDDPTAPIRPFMRDLREAVADELGLAAAEELENLKIYTAVGTPLDRQHGIDAFVTLRDPNGAEVTVTLDATLRQEKLAGELKSNSDIIVGEITDPLEGPDAEETYLKQVAGYAKQVARLLKGRLDRPRTP